LRRLGLVLVHQCSPCYIASLLQRKGIIGQTEIAASIVDKAPMR
jgi:hypothetical protein